MTQEVPVEIFGKFYEPIPNTLESLTINFAPSTAPRKQRWQSAGISASFLGDYFASFFPGDDDISERIINKRDTVKATIAFVANEILENAIKYSDETVKLPVSISLYLFDEKLVFLSTNYANRHNADKYREFIQEIVTAEDITELYIKRIEKTAMGEGGSGLGLITMVNDYYAELGWKFKMLPDPPQAFQVTVMIQLEI